MASGAEDSLEQKGLSTISNVAAIDIAQYSVASKQPQPFPNFNGLQEDVVRYSLQSASSKMNVSCTFTNGKLHILHVLGSEGSPALTRTASNIRDMAESCLSDYTVYTKNPLYNQLGEMLSNVDVGKNSTVTLGNVKLATNATEGGYVIFSWIYTFNGVDAAEKCVSLGYQNGNFKYFVDTWDTYTIASTNVRLSEADAVAIALNTAKDFSYQLGSGENATVVKDLQVTKPMVTQLVFCDNVGADNPRGDDLLMLYPMWRIGVGLDKWYPGNVYGVYVDVWADTGQVRLVQEVFSTLPPEMVGNGLFDNNTDANLNNQVSHNLVDSNSPLISGLFFGSLAFGASTIALILLQLKKKTLIRFNSLPKSSFPKFTVGLLCILLFSGIFIVPISLVNADSRCANIWGDRYYGSLDWNPNLNPNSITKTSLEQHFQDMAAANATIFFDNAGYDANNYQPNNQTLKDNVLSVTQATAQTYDKNIVVYFDHGIGSNNTDSDNGNWHYQLCDNTGRGVYDNEIFDRTQGKTFFAFINTCLSANLSNNDPLHLYDPPYGGGYLPSGAAFGMPFAWMHQRPYVDISIDGYLSPDQSNLCYIGFPWGSASLSQEVDTIFPSRIYYQWVLAFFYYATLDDTETVKNALDDATLMIYETIFACTYLRNGFKAVWGTEWPDDNCRMTIYGNGDICLFNSNPSSPYMYLTISSSANGATNPSAGTYQYTHGSQPTISAIPNQGYALSHWTVDGNNAGSSYQLTVTMDNNHTVEPHFGAGYHLSTQSSAGGSVSIDGGWNWFIPGTQATVRATPNQGYALANWTIDGNYASNAGSLSVTMDGNHTVYATFVPGATLTFDARYGSDPYVSQSVPANLYVDGNLVGVADGTPIAVPLGTHTFSVDLLYYEDYGYYYFNCFAQVTGESYPYTFTPYPNNPITLDCQEDANFLVWYYGAYAYPPKILTVQSSQNGYAYAQGVAFAPGEQVQVNAYANGGYELANWTIDGVPAGENNPLTVTMNDDHTVTAYFDVFCHVNLQSGLGGTAYVIGGSTRFLVGHQASFSVTNILPGFAFANWTVDGQYAGSSLPLTLTMNTDHTVVANFAETVPHHYLTVQYTYGGVAYASSFIYIENTQVQVYEVPDSGYLFTGWTVDDNPAGVDNPLTVTMNTDHVVVAHFAEAVDFNLWAFTGLYNTVYVDLTVDGNYVGTTEYSHQLGAGERLLEVPSEIYDNGEWHYFVCFGIMTDFGMVIDYWEENPGLIDIENLQSGLLYYVAYS